MNLRTPILLALVLVLAPLLVFTPTYPVALALGFLSAAVVADGALEWRRALKAQEDAKANALAAVEQLREEVKQLKEKVTAVGNFQAIAGRGR